MDPSAIAGLAGQIPGPMSWFNLGSDLLTNWQQQQFSEKMYDRTRADNLDFWGRQNAYNTPEQQMQRFQNAGLNPALIYGQGNNGNAQNIPTPDVVPVNFRAPKLPDARPDVMGLLLGQADLKIKAAQANNLNVQTDVIRQDAILRGLQAQTADFDLGFKRDTRDISADMKAEQLRQLSTSIDLSVNRDAREAVMNASNVKEAMERMLTSIEARKGFSVDRLAKRTSVDLMNQDIVTKKLDNALREKGINPGDPMWARIVGRFLTEYLAPDGSPRQSPSLGGSIWKYLFGN